jgi:hypothetical protein
MEVSQLEALAVYRGEGPLIILDRRLDGPQNRPGRCGEGKIVCFCLESSTDSLVVQYIV